jgi:putative protease
VVATSPGYRRSTGAGRATDGLVPVRCAYNGSDPRTEEEIMPEQQEIGVVIHFWSNISVAGIRVTAGELKVGDTIRIHGHTTDFTQVVDSLQKDNESVEVAGPGDDVGLRVKETAREHDKVFVVRGE